MERYARTITFTFRNMFTKQDCFKLREPYIPGKRYSKMYQRLRVAVATNEGVPIHIISASHIVDTSKNNGRVVYEWPGGIVLDVPHDATAYDYEIIKAQLDVISMRFKVPDKKPKTEIGKTIDAIKAATKKACRSKKSARKFLIDAGIVKR